MGLPSASASHVGFLLEMGQWMDRFVIPQYMAFFFWKLMMINHEMLCPVSRHMALSDRESQLSDASSLLSNNVGKTIVNHPQNHQFHRWYKPSNMGWFSINFLFYPDRNGHFVPGRISTFPGPPWSPGHWHKAHPAQGLRWRLTCQDPQDLIRSDSWDVPKKITWQFE